MQAVVEFSLEKTLFPYICDRHGLLVKCTSVDADLAKVLLDTGYKVLSAFQKWCPVKVLQDSCIPFFYSHKKYLSFSVSRIILQRTSSHVLEKSTAISSYLSAVCVLLVITGS